MPVITWSKPATPAYAEASKVYFADVQAKADALIEAMRMLTDDDRTEVYAYLNMHFCKACGDSREHLPDNYLRNCSCTRED